MIPYSPPAFHGRLGQRTSLPVQPVVLPPSPDALYTGYTDIPGILETVAILAVTSAAAWAGIRTGLSESKNKTLKVAGWVGGVGAALIGVMYIGAKSGLGDVVGLPAIRVSPS